MSQTQRGDSGAQRQRKMPHAKRFQKIAHGSNRPIGIFSKMVFWGGVGTRPWC